jgi:transmembrane sensor
MKKETSIGELFFRYTRRELTTEQKRVLSDWRARSPANEALFQYETDPEHTREAIRKIYDLRESVHEKIKTGYPAPWVPVPVKVYKGFQLVRRIAATVILIMVIALYHFTRPDHGIHAGSYQASPVDPNKVSGAIGDIQRGYVIGEQKIKIIEKSNGELEYVIYNDLRASKGKRNNVYTPRGGMVAIHFPDGSNVWLNAESKITYPANYSPDTIYLTLEGEAYFEIANQSHKIYQISSGRAKLQSSDAIINIKSYSDELNQVMTLIKGTAGVQFQSTDSSIRMVANQQAVVNNQNIQINPATDDVTGWKNGKTLYHNADIHTVMLGVAHWYDVDIFYLGDFSNKKFTVNVPRNAEFSELVSELEKQGVRILTRRHIVTVLAKKN